MRARSIVWLALASASVPAPVSANDRPNYVLVNEEAGVPVFAGDITDRPYEVIGEVEAGVRKTTIFHPKASEKKIYRELWERARKLDADAVIKATYGKFTGPEADAAAEDK
jgi:hypothetical protein